MQILRQTLFVTMIALLVGCSKEEPAAKDDLTPSEVISPDLHKEIKPSWADAASKPRLDKAKALEIALAMIKDKNIDLGIFEEPKVDFSPLRKEWSFFYQMKPPVKKGGHFTVVVDDSSAAQFIAGK